MKLYSYWRSSASWRVRIVLAYKRISYEYVAVDLNPAHNGQHDPKYGEINAMRQVPVIEWEHQGALVRLTQSVAIIEHLETIHPSPQLLPDEPLQRARVRELVEIVNSGIQPLQNTGAVTEIRMLAGDDAAAKWTHDVNYRGISALEERVDQHGGRFAVGDMLTLADVFLIPQLYNANRFGVDLTRFPRCVEVAARASELPAFTTAHPDGQVDAVPSVRS